MTRAALETVLKPVVTGLGFELHGIERLAGKRGETLRVYIDHADGISVDDCELVSNQIGAVLDVENILRGSYTLEVSSPGLDRPLFEPDQYRKSIGSVINVRLRHALNGRRNLQGGLRLVHADGFQMEVDGVNWDVPFSTVDRVRLVPQWPGSGRRLTRATR